MKNETNWLIHHGIKGQKWGIKNGPPYPIDKSAKKYSRNNRHFSDYKNIVVGEVSPDIIYSAVTFTALASWIGIAAIKAKVISSKFIKKDVESLKTEIYNSRNFNDFDEVPKLKTKNSTIENAKEVNPNYPNSGYTENCVLCTAAMAMREKGYNVSAKMSEQGHNSNGYFETMFNSSKERVNKKNVIERLKANGNGSYGNISVFWKLGGGHSLFWKNENGTIKIYDAQRGVEVKRSDIMKSIKNNIEINRLDDKKPTRYVLGVITNTKKG